jgi:hypothetical protein
MQKCQFDRNFNIMALFATILLSYAIITIWGIFLTLSMACLVKTCPEKSNGIGFIVIGLTMCTLEQCELSLVKFLFTLYLSALTLEQLPNIRRHRTKQEYPLSIDH